MIAQVLQVDGAHTGFDGARNVADCVFRDCRNR